MKKVPLSVKYSKCARVFKGASVTSSSILADKRTLSPGRRVCPGRFPCLSITARPSLLVPAFQQRHNLWPGSNRAAASGTTPDRVILERRVKSGNAFERTPKPNPLRPSLSSARTTWSLHLAPLHRPGDTRRLDRLAGLGRANMTWKTRPSSNVVPSTSRVSDVSISASAYRSVS